MKIALAGIGKIARDQHIPAITANPDWELAATISRSGTVEGVEAYTGIEDLLSARPDIPVVSLALPPVPRYAYARAAIEAGRHVMLEKPPGATIAEVIDLRERARSAGVTIFATWHSRAANGVAAAREALADRRVTRAHIDWKESVRKWHPGQDWVFDPGGMGVMDPGINALSILTHILPLPVHVTHATLQVPKGRQTPIAADITFTGGVTAAFDWRQEDGETWEIAIETDPGEVRLTEGGARLFVDGAEVAVDGPGEYPGLYAQMADLVRAGESDVDLAPLIHVADAMSLGRRETVAAFSF